HVPHSTVDHVSPLQVSLVQLRPCQSSPVQLRPVHDRPRQASLVHERPDQSSVVQLRPFQASPAQVSAHQHAAVHTSSIHSPPTHTVPRRVRRTHRSRSRRPPSKIVRSPRSVVVPRTRCSVPRAASRLPVPRLGAADWPLGGVAVPNAARRSTRPEPCPAFPDGRSYAVRLSSFLSWSGLIPAPWAMTAAAA